MKSFFSLLFPVVFSLANVKAQTINPSCYSNADGWTVTKIENNYDGTYVYLNFYSYEPDYEFRIVSGMYIENYNNINSAKYYIQRFVNNQLNTAYKLEPYTLYNFILKFDKIPSLWTDINIKEPYQGADYTSWYWDYISLNKSQEERLKIDRFFSNGVTKFLAGAAHPFDDYEFATYIVDYNGVQVTMYYSNGYYTHINIKKSGNFLRFSTSDVVDYNCKVCSPFMSIYLLKKWVLEKDNYETYKTQFERYLGKVLNDMDGCDIASFILTLGWLSYN